MNEEVIYRSGKNGIIEARFLFHPLAFEVLPGEDIATKANAVLTEWVTFTTESLKAGIVCRKVQTHHFNEEEYELFKREQKALATLKELGRMSKALIKQTEDRDYYVQQLIEAHTEIKELKKKIKG